MKDLVAQIGTYLPTEAGKETENVHIGSPTELNHAKQTKQTHPGPNRRTRAKTDQAKRPLDKSHARSPGKNDGSGKSSRANRLPQRSRNPWRTRRPSGRPRQSRWNASGPQEVKELEYHVPKTFTIHCTVEHRTEIRWGHRRRISEAGGSACTPVEWIMKRTTQRRKDLGTRHEGEGSKTAERQTKAQSHRQRCHEEEENTPEKYLSSRFTFSHGRCTAQPLPRNSEVWSSCAQLCTLSLRFKTGQLGSRKAGKATQRWNTESIR